MSLIDTKYETVIDIGCGAGYLTERLYEAVSPKIMYGVDISEEAIRVAKMHGNSDITYVVDDIRNRKIKMRFDLAIVADLIEHIDDDKKFLQDVFDFCENVIIRIPCEKNVYNDLLLKIGISDEYASFRARYGHLHHYTSQSLIRLFTSCGLEVDAYRIFYLGRRTKFINNVAVVLSRIVGVFSRTLAIQLFGGFVVFKLSKKGPR